MAHEQLPPNIADHIDGLLPEIREHWDRDNDGCSLIHLQQLLLGYRMIVLGVDDCPYSPGSARAVSWEMGAEMAARDIRKAAEIHPDRMEWFGPTRAETND